MKRTRKSVATVEESPSQLVRFRTRYEIDKDSGCWLWTGAILKSGYGFLPLGRWDDAKYLNPEYNDGGSVLAHRVSWYIHNGWRCDKRLCVLANRCGTKHCVNPDHWCLIGSDEYKRLLQWQKAQDHGTVIGYGPIAMSRRIKPSGQHS